MTDDIAPRAATPAQDHADATETLPDMTEPELKAFDCTPEEAEAAAEQAINDTLEDNPQEAA